MKVDLLIENAVILTMDAVCSVVTGSVAVADGRIVAIGEGGTLSHLEAADVRNAAGGILLPGFVNTHTHAAMTLFRGLADDLPLMEWLEGHIFPAEATLDARKVRVGSRLGAMEMLASGTTCCCDMYLFADAVADAFDASGIRAVVGEVFFDFPSPAYGPIDQGFSHVENLINRWQSHPRVSVAVQPHSPYLCAPELLQRAKGLADETESRFILHLSETDREVATIRERYGKTPVAHLADLGVLGTTTLADHCVALTDDDIRLLSNTGTKVAHNPQSNLKLGSGIAPVPAMKKAGICVGIGTDGTASNNSLDMVSEMKTAALIQKGLHKDPTVMDAKSVLKMATIDGAKCLGMEQEIGSIEVGKKADLVLFEMDSPHLVPMYEPHSHLLYSASRRDVVLTVVDGEILFENGRFTRENAETLLGEAAALSAGFRRFSC